MFKKRKISREHGEVGALWRTMRSSNRIAWTAVIILTLCFGTYVIIDSTVPQPVLVVDRTGQVIGQISYTNPVVNEDIIKKAGQQFTNYYYSYNSETIWRDLKLAAVHMDPNEANQWIAHIRENDLANKIEKSKWKSSNTYEQVEIVTNGGYNNKWEVQLIGTTELTYPDKKKEQTKFNILLSMIPVQPNENHPLGIKDITITKLHLQ